MRLSGLSPDDNLVEYIELVDHPFFVGTQAHPEFRSRPDTPHPLFVGLVRAALARGSGGRAAGAGGSDRRVRHGRPCADSLPSRRQASGRTFLDRRRSQGNQDRRASCGHHPGGYARLAERGHSVLIEKGAGEGSSIVDEEFEAQGATIVPSASEVFTGAEMIIKVKEPQDSEIELFRPGQILFTYLHLAAYPRMAAALLERDVIAIAYETVQLPDRSLPLLAPMSEIAGRMATQVGAYFLGKSEGGGECSWAGSPAFRSGKVVVIGVGSQDRMPP